MLDDAIGSGFIIIRATESDFELSEDAAWFESVLGGKLFTVGSNLNDTDGKLTEFFTAHDVQNVLIRPDRYIFSGGDNANKLISELRRNLSEYAPSTPTERHITPA